MSPAAKVNVHSRLTMVSSVPTEPIGSTHRLSPLDHAAGSHTVHLLFYYRSSPFTKTERFTMALDSFRMSLSDLLSWYPRMTGRLRVDGDGNWEVKYNDAGVRMFMADVGSTLDEWLRFAGESDERNLTVWEDMPEGDAGSWPTFCIQINEFVGGGVAIGLSFTHLLTDPTGAALFFKSWTDLDRGQPMAHHPPLPDPHLPTPKPQNPKPTRTPPLLATATSTFKFAHATIARRLSGAAADANPFDYLTALFWSRIVELKPHAPSSTHSIAVCVDTRRLLGAPLPENFFGNASHFSQVSLDDETLRGGDGVAEAARQVHRHVTGIREDDVLAAARTYGPELTFVSMEHLTTPGEPGSLVYDARFKNGEKPVHVSCQVRNAEGEGVIVVMPSAEGGLARTVTVTLPKEQIEKLHEDLVISGLEPVVILGGRR